MTYVIRLAQGFNSNSTVAKRNRRVSSKKRRGRGCIVRKGRLLYLKVVVNGHTFWESTGTEKISEAEQKLTSFLTRLDLGKVGTERRITFSAFIDRWRLSGVSCRGLKTKTTSAYESILKNHLLPFFGEMPLRKITAGLVQTWVGQMVIKKNRRGSMLSPKTISNAYKLLSAILATALKESVLNSSPCSSSIDIPKVRKSEMNFLDSSEVKRLLSVVAAGQDRRFVALSILTGLRQGEKIALRPRDIDLKRRVIRVCGTFVNGKVEEPKTDGSAREVQFGSEVAAILKEQYESVPADSKWLFVNATGGPIDPANFVKRVFKPALIEAETNRPIRWHDLRHTYASIQLNEGVNLKFLQKQLGHTNIQTTLNRYGHLIHEKHEDALDKFERLCIDGVSMTGVEPTGTNTST